jgi:DNA glycosylase AlkZ-like
MRAQDIVQNRLYNQRIANTKLDLPGQVVSWMGAMQAQDFASAMWAVGFRCTSATRADIEQAMAKRTILRTWLLRGTLHLVSPDDIHWMLRLLSPRLIASAERRNRQLELDSATFSRSFKILTKELQNGRIVTRSDLMQALERAGVSTAGQRGYHILGRAAHERLICFGPQQGKQQTFVLLDEWAPEVNRLTHDEALIELAMRYFSSHGPATIRDFTWWSGLVLAEARMALELAKAQLAQETIQGQTYWLRPNRSILTNPSPGTYLLPAFDEYFLGYTDRSAVLNPRYDPLLVSNNGIFRPMLVIDGQVMGVWKQETSKRSVKTILMPFKPLNRHVEQLVASAADRYGTFLDLPAEVIITDL